MLCFGDLEIRNTPPPPGWPYLFSKTKRIERFLVKQPESSIGHRTKFSELRFSIGCWSYNAGHTKEAYIGPVIIYLSAGAPRRCGWRVGCSIAPLRGFLGWCLVKVLAAAVGCWVAGVLSRSVLCCRCGPADYTAGASTFCFLPRLVPLDRCRSSELSLSKTLSNFKSSISILCMTRWRSCLMSCAWCCPCRTSTPCFVRILIIASGRSFKGEVYSVSTNSPRNCFSLISRKIFEW